jgi:hypothetical protein
MTVAEDLENKIPAVNVEDDNEKSALLDKSDGRNSISTGGSSKMAGGRARMLNETFNSKFNAMFWPLASLIFNCGMFGLLVASQQKMILFNMDSDAVKRYIPVILEVILEVANVFCFYAADSACCVLFGYLLSREKGFSLAACGFSKLGEGEGSGDAV